MRNEEVKVKKLNNKGFSLVEIIIVIAIMAILAGALAPQLIKYIDKSRKSADIQTAQTIATAVNAALADEEGYKDANNTNIFSCYNASVPTEFQKIIKDILGGTSPTPKYNSVTDFYIEFNGDKTFQIYASSTELATTELKNQLILYPTVGSSYK